VNEMSEVIPWYATAPIATVLIMAIALAIAFINSLINRGLIGHFIGWDKYRTMQKEMAEFRSESMAAARSNDKKQMEKLKKRQSQINSMQAQMAKPQMIQFGISFVYIIVWLLILTPTFGNYNIAAIPFTTDAGNNFYLTVFWWYPMVSFFLSIFASRIIGVMPIE
jgi:uncharacterized membrane protein (DUF106 family)